MKAAVGAAAALAVGALCAPASAKDLGLNVHQSTSVGLDATRDAGARWVRVDMNWTDIEKSQGTFDFSLFDTQVDGAASRGLHVLAVLAYGPAWASVGDTKADGSINDVPKAGTYAAFVTAAVTHFNGRVTHYEMWNEPNLGQFFEGTPSDYIARVLVPGADAVHAACASCKVVGPGLATVGTEYATWMDAVLTAAESKIDIVSGHIYAGIPEALQPPSGTTSDSFFNKLEAHRVVKFGTAIVYEGPLSFKEVMDKHGTTKPFWLTETGKGAALGDVTAENAQAFYYRRVLELMLSRPWWTGTIFYEAFDEPPAPYTWGVVVHDAGAPGGYQPKAVMALLKKVTSSQPVYGGTKTDCDDGLDNDQDGLVDFPADPDCATLAGASEGIAPPLDAGTDGAGQDAGVGAEGEEDSGTGTGTETPAGSSGGCDGCAAVAARSDVAGVGGLVAALLLAARARSRRRLTGPELTRSDNDGTGRS